MNQENNQLFKEFYYDFLLNELKIYINQKHKLDYADVNEIFQDKDKFIVLDRILVETFIEVREKSYSEMFLKLDLTRKEKIQYIIESGKELFKDVKEIEDESEEKYEQYYTMFELIGTYLYKSFKNNNLFKRQNKNN